MLPTPTTPSLPPSIYPPSEDTHLLLDALSSQIRFLTVRFPPTTPTPLIYEIGTGNGVVLSFITQHALQILGRNDVLSLGGDVNPTACRTARQTVRSNCPEAVFLGMLEGDLASPVVRGAVDVLLCNPPYVPSETVPEHPGCGPEDASDRGIFTHEMRLQALATDGGADGMEVTGRLLGQLEAVLSRRGVAYVVLCARNGPEEVRGWVGGWEGRWEAELVAESRGMGGWERLRVLRVARGCGAG